MSIRSTGTSEHLSQSATSQPAHQAIEAAQAAIAAAAPAAAPAVALAAQAAPLDSAAVAFLAQSVLSQDHWAALRNDYIARIESNPFGCIEEIIRELKERQAPSELIHEMALAAVRKDGFALEVIDDDLKKDKQIVLAAIEATYWALEFVDEELKTDPEIQTVIISAIKEEPRIIEFASEEMRKDKEIALAAVQLNANVLEFLDKELQSDLDVVRAAIECEPLILGLLGEDFRANIEIVKLCVQKNGMALEFASDELKKDFEIVDIAINQTAFAFQFAHEELRSDSYFRSFSRFPSSVRLPTPDKFRSKALPKLPSECGLDALKEAVDALSWDVQGAKPVIPNIETRERLHAAIKASYAGQLLETLKINPMTQAEFEAKTPEERGTLCNKFLAVSAYYGRGGALDDASYAAYCHYCTKVNENVAKLRNQLTSCHGELGTPNPETHPGEYKDWLKQALTQLTYIENYIKSAGASIDSEFLRLQLSTCTDACASRTQAVLSKLFSDTLDEVTPGEDHEIIFLRHLKKAHDTVINRIIASLGVEDAEGSDSHVKNQIDNLLSGFGFLPQVKDAILDLPREAILELFPALYPKAELVDDICKELDSAPSARGLFTEEMIKLSGEEIAQIEGQVAEGTLREAITQREDFGARFLTGACTLAEKALIPKELQTEALRTAYQHAYPGAEASAAADVPSFDTFARARREAALPHLLRRVALDDLCIDKIEASQRRRFPVDATGRVKAAAVKRWLLEQGFFG